MIVTITLNPCLDNYIAVSGLEPDETNRSQAITRYAGGKGINVSRAVNEMGGETVVFGLIGGHEGNTLTSLLFAEGVPVSFTPIAEDTRACFIIDDSLTNRQTRISPPGPRVRAAETRKLLAQIWKLGHKPEMLVCGGSVPPGLPPDTYASIIKAARRRGVRTILDSSGDHLKAGVKAAPYLIKPNVSEAEELLGRELTGETDIIRAAREMVGLGVEIAVISRAAGGLIAASAGEVIKAVPPQVTPVSAVGAGDCTVAGLAMKLAQGADLAMACRLAAAMGTAAVLTPGTELLKRAQVEKLLPLIQISSL